MSQEETNPAAVKGQEKVDHSNDLVIRDGFPALLLVDDKDAESTAPTKWWIDETDETMKLPRWAFWSHERALQYDPEALLRLVEDCRRVFTARTREDHASYSAGTTYFLPALLPPRCALEALVRLIFQRHADLLPLGMYRPDQSGAEWWTLVLDDDDQQGEDADDVGWHYDADYGLEDQAPGLLLHPRVATVTYLSNCGVPTVVTDCGTPQGGQVQQLHGRSISKAYVSYPKIGKHMAFDGRLLHGAPSDVFPGLQARSKDDAKGKSNSTWTNNETADEEPPPTKRIKTQLDSNNHDTRMKQPLNPQRITLLVNIWLNHCPLDAELLDDELTEQLTPSSNTKLLFHWNEDADMSQPTKLATAHVRVPPTEAGVAAAAAAKKDDEDDDALEDEIVICKHKVRVQYGATMEEYHAIADAMVAGNDDSNDGAGCSSVAVDLDKGAISLQVGDPVSDSEAEDEE